MFLAVKAKSADINPCRPFARLAFLLLVAVPIVSRRPGMDTSTSVGDFLPHAHLGSGAEGPSLIANRESGITGASWKLCKEGFECQITDVEEMP